MDRIKVERAIDGLTEWRKHVQTNSDIDRDISTAIEALKAQLSREGTTKDATSDTIQPEPKEGHWIGSDGSYICSECNGSPLDFIDTMGASFDAYVETLMKFCPNCGARMKGE
jgi:hypothetical protein